MVSKDNEKETAVKLRKQGYSYTEILKKVSVSKATLSEWL
jgi:transposase